MWLLNSLRSKGLSLLCKREYGFSRVGVGNYSNVFIGTPSATLLLVPLLKEGQCDGGSRSWIYSVYLWELLAFKDSPS